MQQEITGRTIILLGGSVTVAASSGITATATLTGAAGLVRGGAAAVAFSSTLGTTVTQGTTASAALVAGTAMLNDEGLALRAGSAALSGGVVLDAAGGTVFGAASVLAQDLVLSAAGGLEVPAGAAALEGELTVAVVNPGLLFDGGDVTFNMEVVLDGTTSPLFRLVLPTALNVFTRDRLWGRFPIRTGIALLVESGVVRLTEAPSDTELKEADMYFLGGYRHQITSAERAVLVAAGYGGLVEEA